MNHPAIRLIRSPLSMPFVYLLAIFAFTLAPAHALEAPLQGLDPEHPRLILSDEALEEVREHIRHDETARTYFERLLEQAETLMDRPTVEYKIVGPRLLSQSRRCLERIYTLGLVYRITGEARFLERAQDELDAAAGFPDWNPSHFLDTAEMTHAFAIGYDWFYHDLSEAERERYRQAIVTLGLEPALEAYETDRWWIDVDHNWNQVCNGGIAMGALAIADEAPGLAGSIIENVVHYLPEALASYAPDGGWAEGPGYWHYATRYTVYALAAFESALGHDFDLSESPGFDRCGHFYLYAAGPSGQTFNYADAGSGVGPAHELFWLAQRFDHPVYAWMQRQLLEERESASALDLIWYTPEGENPEESGLPLDVFFDGVEVAFLRSEWMNPDHIYVGFKGGDNQANHSHLDLGVFVLDAFQERWVLDLGPDNYNLPGYFGGKRWDYFRLNTQSHNTLIIGGENQNERAKAPIEDFASSPGFAYAIADLSHAYHDARVRRGIALIDRAHVLLQDEIDKPGSDEVVWQIMTDAQLLYDKRQATLSKNGKRVAIRLLSPPDAAFSVAEGNPPEPQRQHPHAKRLQVRLPSPPEQPIAVVFTPFGRRNAAQPFEHERLPLNEWAEAAAANGSQSNGQ